MLCCSTKNRSGHDTRRGISARHLGPAICILLSAGCRLISETEYDRPSFSEQQQAILDIVPFGTARGRAVEALKQAGVQGTSGVSESIYYCDVWDRSDGRNWHLDIALLFDQSGRLYKVRSSQSETGKAVSLSEDSGSRRTIAPGTLTPSSAASAGSGGSPEWAQSNAPSGADRTAAGRTGRRTPFADSDSLE